jgi:SAM-dependent methyltransferase
MNWSRAVLSVLRLPDLRARLLLARDLRTFIRVHFLFAAQRLGLLAALSSPSTAHELLERLKIQRPDLFRLLLDLGVSLGEFAEEGGRYRLMGGRAKALAGRGRETLEGVLEEGVLYDASVYRELPQRLGGAALGDYLKDMAPVVARASRVFEPFIRDYLRGVLASIPARRVLDVGCGSGIYLQVAAEASRETTGVGIDLHDRVVQMARRNLERWGIADRLTVSRADIRGGTAGLGGRFDLILLINNVYYFSPEERRALFRELRLALTDRGSLVLVSMLHGRTPTALHLDLVLASTVGCYPLPHLEPLSSQLKEAGFGEIRAERLIPSEPFYGVSAR